ncbi:MAG: hypothetical protein ABEJ87_00080 [Candidatus Nanohalobium sp.]
MEESGLRMYAEETLEEGYTKEDLKNLLIDEGHDEDQVNYVLRQIDDEKFGRNVQTSVSAFKLDDRTFSVRKGLLDGSWSVENSSGDEVLKASEEAMEDRELLAMNNSEGKPAFQVEEGESYRLVDTGEEKPFMRLEESSKGPGELWKLETMDGSHIADVKYGNTALGLFRSSSRFLSFMPASYEVEADGEVIATVNGSLRGGDEYTVVIEGGAGISEEALLAAVLAVDSF